MEDCNCRCALLTMPRWEAMSADEFTKVNNETGELVSLFNVKNLEEFKKRYAEAVDKSGGSSILNNNKAYRKVSNLGDFSILPERMSKKNIRSIAKKYNIDLGGLIINIDTNNELLRFPLAGEAVPEKIGKITFFPNAFKSEEEIIRTLYHEKIHVKQYEKYGVEYVQNHMNEFEQEAYSKEK